MKEAESKELKDAENIMHRAITMSMMLAAMVLWRAAA
jgi:hypothetical protein